MSSIDSDGDAPSVNYNSLTVQQLKQEFGRRNLSLKGLRLKAELIKALSENDAAQPSILKQRKTTSSVSNVNGDVEPSKSNGIDTIELRHKIRMKEKTERDGIVLWRRPITTLQYFIIESSILLRDYVFRLLKNKRLVMGLLLAVLFVLGVMYIDGPHQKQLLSIQKQVMWCAYWVGLGILSSVGLGTGLHTFLLYLGPHIAAVTLAAFECMSVDFPEPPYPDDIICPESGLEQPTMSLWTILSKVRLEAFMWGAGTALGELPPYFMARAARLSGDEVDDDEFEELEELIHEKEVHPDQLSFIERTKLGVHQLVQRVGFVGILACASIPNPLFDLAGITCGHFLIPFWTFFGATLIGKAIIKMHIQKLFVIFMFSEHHVESLVAALKHIPYFGISLQVPFKEYLEKQKKKLHVTPGTRIPASESWLSWIFEKVIIVMVIYFVLSIVNSLAQSYHKRLCKERHELKAKLID